MVAEAAAAWDAGAPHLGLEATWRLLRETNAELEVAEPWKAEPGPGVDAVLGSALEVLRIVSVLVVPAMPVDGPGDLATDRPARAAPRTSGSREPAAWGGYPGGLPVEKGAPLFPRRKD